MGIALLVSSDHKKVLQKKKIFDRHHCPYHLYRTLHSNNAFSFMNLQVGLNMLKATGFELQCIFLKFVN